VEEKLWVAEPFISASVEVCTVPSTTMVSVPVGVTVLEADAEATVMVIRSFAPGAGEVVAAESVVFETTGGGRTTVMETVPGVVEVAPLLSVTLKVKLSAPTYPVVGV
jgi:hypothetical protein